MGDVMGAGAAHWPLAWGPLWGQGLADAGGLVNSYTQLDLPQTGSLTTAAIIWEH